MPTQGEFEYFKKIGEGGMRHAAGKPWSYPDCGLYLMELGAIPAPMPETGRPRPADRMSAGAFQRRAGTGSRRK